MRNYIKIGYMRCSLGVWDPNTGNLAAAYNKDLIAEDFDGLDDQFLSFFDEIKNNNPNFDVVPADTDKEERFLELNKDYLVRLLQMATAVQQIFFDPDHDQTWLEGANQAGHIIDLIWRKTSPRQTWSHGH